MRLPLIAFLVVSTLAAADPGDPRQALVKIFSVVTRPDWKQPWSKQRPGQGTGSGACIGDGLILTNAHVVADATFLEVRRHGRSERVRAQVAAVDHGADLALLRVGDEAFFAGITPLTFGDLPETQAELTVLGFPTGGDTLSSTRGVLSRVENRHYAHSGFFLLAAQLDAAINPGNSGGPVLHNGRIVGVVMQGMTNADNIGYMIPIPVIRHVLDDLTDGRIDGWPTLDCEVQGLQSPALRRLLDLADHHTGQRVVRVHPRSTAAGLLRPDDVLLAIDGHGIADDGTIELRPGERTHWAWAVQHRQIGDDLPVRIVRDGEEHDLAIPLKVPNQANHLVALERYDVDPSWFVFGGLIFTPLSRAYLQTWGRDWNQRAPRSLLTLMDEQADADDLRTEIVILAGVLPHAANLGYHGASDIVIEGVDGQPIANLADLVAKVESGTGPLIRFDLPKGYRLVIDRAEAAAAAAEIAKVYRIPGDRSLDLPPAQP